MIPSSSYFRLKISLLVADNTNYAKKYKVVMVTVTKVLPSISCHCVAMITVQMQADTSCYSIVMATVAKVMECNYRNNDNETLTVPFDRNHFRVSVVYQLDISI